MLGIRYASICSNRVHPFVKVLALVSSLIPCSSAKHSVIVLGLVHLFLGHGITRPYSNLAVGSSPTVASYAQAWYAGLRRLMGSTKITSLERCSTQHATFHVRSTYPWAS